MGMPSVSRLPLALPTPLPAFAPLRLPRSLIPTWAGWTPSSSPVAPICVRQGEEPHKRSNCHSLGFHMTPGADTTAERVHRSRPGSAALLHVLARPLGKGGEAARNEGIGCGDGGPRVRTEIGMRLEVLVHLAQLFGAGEKAVKDRRRDPHHPDVVSERIERRDEIVPRVRAAANGEVATVR